MDDKYFEIDPRSEVKVFSKEGEGSKGMGVVKLERFERTPEGKLVINDESNFFVSTDEGDKKYRGELEKLDEKILDAKKRIIPLSDLKGELSDNSALHTLKVGDVWVKFSVAGDKVFDKEFGGLKKTDSTSLTELTFVDSEGFLCRVDINLDDTVYNASVVVREALDKLGMNRIEFRSQSEEMQQQIEAVLQKLRQIDRNI